MMRRWLVVVLVLICSLPAAGADGSAAQQDYVVEVTPSDLLVRSGVRRTEVVYSARRWAENELHAFLGFNAGRPLNCDYEHRIEAISLVGPYLGLRDAFYASCPPEAHPAEETRLLTIDLSASRPDLRHPGMAVAATDLFPADAIRASLQNAPQLRPLLPNTSPRTLKALLSAVAGKYGTDPDDCFYVARDLLNRFAFVGSEDSHAVVALGLPGAGPCRTNLTEIRLALDAPRALQPALANAAEGRAGFLPGAGSVAPVITIRLQVGQGAMAPGKDDAPPADAPPHRRGKAE